MRVGLISDTHGLLRDEALSALAGCDLIVHAGDVGSPRILESLRKIAPVTAVRGNIDKGDWAEKLPLTAAVAPDGVSIYVVHDLKTLDLDPRAAQFQIVVSGHTHKPAREERNGVLYLNPGSAGPRRFRLPVTVGILDLGSKPWELRVVGLLS
jgi:putative phosphoesterase